MGDFDWENEGRPEDHWRPSDEAEFKRKQTTTRLSQLLDAWVVVHAVVAISFATCMLLAPSMFSLFLADGVAATPVAQDAIRWASPFVFGFGGLAVLSLRMNAAARRDVATMYCGAFLLAVVVGSYVQTTGRWSSLHLCNIVLFASLAMVYAGWLLFFPEAFERGGGSLPEMR